MRFALLTTASVLTLTIASSASASEIMYTTEGALNRFNATQSGVSNQIGEETLGNGNYIYPWDYNAAQQIGVNNTANVTQNGASNLANFKQGRDNVHVYDEGFAYSFGSVTEAVFNTLNLSQMGEDNVGFINQPDSAALNRWLHHKRWRGWHRWLSTPNEPTECQQTKR